MSKFFTLILSFFWFCSLGSLSAQSLLNSFPIKNAPLDGGLYVPYDDEDGTAHLFVYPNLYDLRVLYLDANFNLLDDVRVFHQANHIGEIEIVDLIDRPDSIILMVRDLVDDYACLIYNKKQRSLKVTNLEIRIKMGALYSFPIVYGGAFLSLEIPRKSSAIVVHRSFDGYELESDTFDIGLENLKQYYNLPQTNLLFPITAEGGNNLFSNIADAKLYLYGQMLYLSLENPEEGSVQVFSIDLESKEILEQKYEWKHDLKDEALKCATSLIYEDLILLATYQEEVGLKLDIYDVGLAERLQEYAFASNQAMDTYFLPAEAHRNDGTALEGKEDLLAFLRKSLILSLEPTAEGDLWLIVGSIRQMSPEAQYALILSSAMAGAFLGATIDPVSFGNGWVNLYPVDGLVSSTELILGLSDRYGKFMYRVGAINAQDLSLKSQQELLPQTSDTLASKTLATPYQKMDDFLAQNREYKPRSAAQIRFPYQGGIVHGFVGRKRVMKLYYFENP